MITFSQHWLTSNLSRFLYHMKDCIFLINILKFDDPIRCNYWEINDKKSKRHYFLFTTEISWYRYFATFSLVTFKINISWNLNFTGLMRKIGLSSDIKISNRHFKKTIRNKTLIYQVWVYADLELDCSNDALSYRK